MSHMTTPMATPTTTRAQPNPEPEPTWSDLPKAVLNRIARHLNWQTDLPRARAVCPSWRAHLPKNPPLISTTKFSLPSVPFLPFDLTPTHFYLLTPLSPNQTHPNNSPSPWLIRVRQTSPNKYSLLNPLDSSEYFFPDPPISTTLSILNTHVLELSTTYTLFIITHGIDGDKPARFSKKVVGGWALDSPTRFSFMAQLHSGLIFWKLGDKAMTDVRSPYLKKPLDVVDIAYYNHKYYAFECSTWQVGVVDPLAALVMGDNAKMVANMEFHPAPDVLLLEAGENHIVSFDGVPHCLEDVSFVSTRVGLYLVFEAGEMDGGRKTRMVVYKMRESGTGAEMMSWENVVDLEDQVFFIGNDAAFALPSASLNLPLWKPNSICLFNHLDALAVDGYERGSGREMPEGVERLAKIMYPAYWKYLKVFVIAEEEKGVVPFMLLPKEVYTGLFFPPPPWVKWQWTSPVVGVDDVEVKFDKLVFRNSVRPLSETAEAALLMLEERLRLEGGRK